MKMRKCMSTSFRSTCGTFCGTTSTEKRPWQPVRQHASNAPAKRPEQPLQKKKIHTYMAQATQCSSWLPFSSPARAAPHLRTLPPLPDQARPRLKVNYNTLFARNPLHTFTAPEEPYCTWQCSPGYLRRDLEVTGISTLPFSWA